MKAGELGRALMALGEAVADGALLRDPIRSLRLRLELQRFQLAVLGQFKHGKSTFINAMLGAPLLPIAVVPLTAVPVFISWRSHALVQVLQNQLRSEQEHRTCEPEGVK